MALVGPLPFMDSGMGSIRPKKRKKGSSSSRPNSDSIRPYRPILYREWLILNSRFGPRNAHFNFVNEHEHYIAMPSNTNTISGLWLSLVCESYASQFAWLCGDGSRPISLTSTRDPPSSSTAISPSDGVTVRLYILSDNRLPYLYHH